MISYMAFRGDFTILQKSISFFITPALGYNPTSFKQQESLTS